MITLHPLGCEIESICISKIWMLYVEACAYIPVLLGKIFSSTNWNIEICHYWMFILFHFMWKFDFDSWCAILGFVWVKFTHNMLRCWRISTRYWVLSIFFNSDTNDRFIEKWPPTWHLNMEKKKKDAIFYAMNLT